MTKRMRQNLRDEMLLAKMIAGAKAQKLKGTVYTYFRDADGECIYVDGNIVQVKNIRACCAIGSLILIGKLTHKSKSTCRNGMITGNDDDGIWSSVRGNGYDRDESIGWAFRCAMEE